MSLARAHPAPTKPIYLETPHLYMRTLTPGDATDGFAAWFDQDEVRQGLNLPAQKKTKADIAAYIASFDQVSKILICIFEPGSRGRGQSGGISGKSKCRRKASLTDIRQQKKLSSG